MKPPLAFAPRRLRAALAGFGAVGALAVSSPALSADPSHVAGSVVARLPDGRKLNFRCAGAGGPTVVFESGWGADSGEWVRVLPMLAPSRQACSYDRAGYGASDPGPDPRDAAAIVRDLRAGLRAARIRGPYILVGHSAGGLYVRLFAAKYPKDVAGLVLVDPSVEHQDARFAAAFGLRAGSIAPLQQRAARCLAAAREGRLPSVDPALSACTPTSYLAHPGSLVGLWGAESSEIDNLFTTSSDEVQRDAEQLDDLPLVVLTAGGETTSLNPGLVLWARLHREVAATSRRGSARLVDRTTHMMMFQRPDAIVSAINDVAAAAKGRQ
ncbi:MAG TPA: alpha/beta hydrolase [Caulobacteraceae bacterium]|nr:alpha/beta hydrolase [Caulobacteraceae bacterium]